MTEGNKIRWFVLTPMIILTSLVSPILLMCNAGLLYIASFSLSMAGK